MLRIILHGARGHMGRVVRELIGQEEGMEIVAGIDAADGEEAPFPIYADAADCAEEADVIIDFSTAAATAGLLRFAVSRKLPLVLCTTGLSEELLGEVRAASEEIPVLRSANMSLGINTVLKLVKAAAEVLNPAGFDIEIEEMHHRRKLDAPSGTALLLADGINEALDGKMEYVYGRVERREARPEQEIGITALRGGTVVGEHKVVFAGTDEVITVSHSAFSRTIFRAGT